MKIGFWVEQCLYALFECQDDVNEITKNHTKTVSGPGRVAQSVTCLAIDACLTADPGVASSMSVTSKSMCTNYWLTACSSLPRKKCG